MSMFCYQCQEAAGCTGCTVRGVCGKPEDTAKLQDLLIFALKGVAVAAREVSATGETLRKTGRLIQDGLFTTITNANFDNPVFEKLVREAVACRDTLFAGHTPAPAAPLCLTWQPGSSSQELLDTAASNGVLATENEDVRSLRELLIYGIKGIAAYSHHACILDKEDDAIYSFLIDALASTTDTLEVPDMIALVLKCGEMAVTTMALLDAANTGAYGNPELSQVNLGTRGNPGILVSGHDLRDMADLLEQTVGTGVDVYTHSEMLPTHYYPAFKKYDHLVGNYGGSWWHQGTEFASFNGPILMTTNCITPVKDAYKERIYTSGAAGYPGVPHIPERPEGGQKDFSAIIAQAKSCPPPEQLEEGTIVGGFAHNQVLALADKVVDAVKSGAIKRFVVMAGCDGRQRDRQYFTDVAEGLPEGTVILTAGCAKYRYNKLNLGDIGGIPRVLDAGQCNDSYSLAVVALKLVEVFGVNSINDLPISFDIAWYEQKAVAVLLALLYLGVKGIRLGPTLPAFLSPTVVKVLVENFDIKPTGEVAADVEAMMAGK